MTTTTGNNLAGATACRADMQYCHDYFEQLFRANFFKCLNDETRQKIILVVGQDGEQGMRVADIARHFDLDRTTISHHLALMRDNNLLRVTKCGKERYYAVNIDYIAGALEEAANILRSCCGEASLKN